MKFVSAGKTYVDTAFLNSSAVAGPGCELVHRGFGEFKCVTPVGTVFFARGGVAFEGCSGRSHSVSGDEAAVALVLGSSEKEAA